EPFDFVVSETHRLATRNTIEFKDLASETLLVNTGCEMAEQLSARLAAQGDPRHGRPSGGDAGGPAGIGESQCWSRRHPHRGGNERSPPHKIEGAQSHAS